MKNRKNKILIIFIIAIFAFFILSLLQGECYASSDTPGIIENAIDGLVGVLLLPTKFIVLIVGGLLGLIMGAFSENGNLGNLIRNGGLTLEDILFNRVSLLDINFFDFTTKNNTSLTIRENIAIWYTSIRNIAAVVLVVIAVYVGIRMALSTIAEDKAKYKTMLIDWLTSLALLFILQYIMIFTINVNNAFINTLSTGLGKNSFDDMGNEFLTGAISNFSFTTGLGCAIIYLLLQGITFVFLLTYIKRMITLAFLIVISPIVTITYSIDKMGDGKSQALNVWFKEYVYNILIQPFHCISYLVLGRTALELVTANRSSTGNLVADGANYILSGTGLANAVLAIAILIFIYSSEKIVRHIFHFENQSMGETIANAAIVGTLLSKIGGGAKSASGAASGGRYTANKDNEKGKNPQTKDSKDSKDSKDEKDSNTVKNDENSDLNNEPKSESTSYTQTNESKTNGPSSYSKQNDKLLKKAGRFVMAANFRTTGAVLMGTLFSATGEEKAGITGALSGEAIGASLSEANKTRIQKQKTSRAINDYKRLHPELTEDKLIENTLGFADGSKEATTDAEKSLRDAMQDMQAQFIRNGADDKKLVKQSKQFVKDVNNGLISEISATERFTGKIKNATAKRKPRTK